MTARLDEEKEAAVTRLNRPKHTGMRFGQSGRLFTCYQPEQA